MKVNTYLIVTRYLSSKTSTADRMLHWVASVEAAKLTEEQLIQTEQFRNSHVPPCNILRFFWEQNVGCAVSAQKIYNIVVKIKKNRMQGRNTVEEILCLSAKWGYTIFYRNCEDNNVLSNIVVAHPTPIEMMIT
ncbi:hypothetical protein M9H77_24070 [Catharanthus roseus]|uniref:Uncharacterized protein n=1 Tax=Catharanthus roseus TaxID=4058 RepID=A0ACC0AWB3_CATRO|nr:hypothetical protein M9H77_24070 [Catharanthus roseus]